MKKILLINNVIREFAPPNNAPLGLLYIAAYLEKHGHSVDICDLNALRTINADREHWLSTFKADYDIVGLSGLISTAQEQRRVLSYLLENRSEFGDPMLIAGGGLATSVPEFTLRYMPELDGLVIGEGEETMLALAGGASLQETSGVAYRDSEGSFVKTDPMLLIPRLDCLPFPDYSKIPIEVYLKNPIWGGDMRNSSEIGYQATRSLNMINSRGCPRACKFCYHYTFGKKYRMRSVDNVIAEMRELKEKWDIDFIGFVDDNSTFDRAWGIEFCLKLVDADLGIRWGCSARVDQVDFDMLLAMKQAGCEWIGFGIESGSQVILDAMDKKTTPAIAADAIRTVREAGMTANGTFICGYLHESVDTLRETAVFMRKNDMLGNMFFAAPYPKTALYDQVLPKILAKYGSEDAYILSLGDATEFRINLTDMSDSDLYLYWQMAIGGIPF